MPIEFSWGSKQKNKNSKRSRDEEESEDSSETIDLFEMLSKRSKGQQQQDNIYSIDNNIYFQDDITLDSISSLNKEIRLLANGLLAMSSSLGIESPIIKLHITSYGGSVHAALSAIDCIESSKVPIHTIIDGYAASAATLISVCGAKRYIKKHATMLIHQVRAGAWGKFSEMEDDFANLQKMHEKIKKIYIEKTKLKRVNLINILKHDLDWDAKECLANGLVDEII